MIVAHLPGGYVDETGNVHRQAGVRSMTGYEEELLAGAGSHRSEMAVTTVLARCVERIGAISPISESVARALTVADRQFLLMKIREATFGPVVNASVVCPWPDCGERVAIRFAIDELPVLTTQELGTEHFVTIKEGNGDANEAGERRMRFRLPNGEDQEVIAAVVERNDAEALTILLSRCVRDPEGHPFSVEQVAGWPSHVRRSIEERMVEVAPHVARSISVKCGECRRGFDVPIDIHHFLLGEFQVTPEALYREVHYLAYHYHWSEQDVLQLTREKRQRYLDILAEHIEHMNDACESF